MSIFAGAMAAAMQFPAAHAAENGDVYVVYRGEDRNVAIEALGRFPEGVRAKKYNVDLLLLADYAGKQKVIAKFARAERVYFLGAEAQDVFGQAALGSVNAILLDRDALPDGMFDEPGSAAPTPPQESGEQDAEERN